MNLKNKVFIVTGAGRGIGRGIASKLANAGATVALNDIDPKKAENVQKEIQKFSNESKNFIADVTKTKEVEIMVQRVLKKYKKIDGLINNTGGSARDRASLFHESSEEIWDYVINLNLKSTFIVTRAVINHMIERKTGKIINISSGAGITGQAKIADYSAAKAGIIGFTKAIAREVGEFGINVNCVAPGFIATGDVLSKHSADFLIKGRKQILLPREGTPEDVGNVVKFLCSEEADYITGEVILVGGGGYLG